MKGIRINLGGGLLSTLLTVLFVYLKLTAQISWSWIWVLSPLWIPFAIVFTLAILCIIILLISWTIKLMKL